MSLLLAAVGTLLLACLIPALFFPADTLRLLRRKNYQYEVTFGLYMLTSTEKIVLNSFLFITSSMIVLAVFFYFPRHVSEISSRVLYYYNGHFLSSATHPISSMAGSVATINSAIQSSLSHVGTSQRLINASQQVMTGAQDLVKGLAAAAAAEMAHTLNGAAAAAENVAAGMKTDVTTPDANLVWQPSITAEPL